MTRKNNKTTSYNLKAMISASRKNENIMFLFTGKADLMDFLRDCETAGIIWNSGTTATGFIPMVAKGQYCPCNNGNSYMVGFIHGKAIRLVSAIGLVEWDVKNASDYKTKTEITKKRVSAPINHDLERLQKMVNRVNAAYGRKLSIDYCGAIPNLAAIKEWDRNKQEFSVYERRMGEDCLADLLTWLEVNYPLEKRCGSHVYYARLSYRSPACAALVRVTTRSALVAAYEVGDGAETVEIQSLHGRVLDIATRRSDGTYKRLK